MAILVSVQSFGIGGGSLKYTSKGFFPRQRVLNLRGLTFKTRNGVRFFPDPTPGHLRFPDTSFKLQNEPELNRWQWIHDMENSYADPVDDPGIEPMAAASQHPNEKSEAEKIVADLLKRIEMLQER